MSAEDLAKRPLEDLTEEYNARLYGPSTDDNLDRTHDLLQAIQLKRADHGSRIDALERKVANQRAYIVMLGVTAFTALSVAHYGREAVASWTPAVLGLIFAYGLVMAFRGWRRRSALKRKLGF